MEHLGWTWDRTIILCYWKVNMNATWIVSANAGRARFFAQQSASAPLEEVNDMANDAVRLRTSETESDDLGLRSASKSPHSVAAPRPQSGYEPPQTPAEHQAEMFARDVADYLLQAYQEGRYKQLCLAVSPEFLGTLRKLLDPRIVSAVKLEINKDYTQFSPQQLRDQLRVLKEKS